MNLDAFIYIKSMKNSVVISKQANISCNNKFTVAQNVNVPCV